MQYPNSVIGVRVQLNFSWKTPVTNSIVTLNITSYYNKLLLTDCKFDNGVGYFKF